VFELASGQGHGSQVGMLREDAFLQEAIFQLKLDIRGEVFQVKPAGDPGPRIRSPCGSGSAASRPRKMSRITAARHVRDSPHDRIAASSTASPLAARSSHSPQPTCATSDCSTEVNSSLGT
jgi:hypothetical protein